MKNKKYNLLKVIGIAFLIFVVLSWFIPTGYYSSGTYTKGETSPVGLYGIFTQPLYSFDIFMQYILIFLAIGGLYGVMNKTGAYSRIVSGLAKKFSKKKKLFLAISIIFFALLASLTGANMALFVLVPFVIAVILLLGFDKLTALASTVGAIIVGSIGSTYGNAYIFKNYFEISANNNILVKIILLVLVTALLIFVVFKNTAKKDKKVTKIDKKEKKSKISAKKEVKEEVKEIKIPLYEAEEKGIQGKKKKSTLPLIIVFLAAFIFLLVGMFNWYYTFEIDVFTKFHETITTFEVGGIPIFAKILGGITEIGYFSNYDLTAILVIVTLLIGWLYGLKFGEIFDSFIDGAKKMLLPAIYVVLASVIFSIMVNSNYGDISATITNAILGMVEKFNIIIVAILGLIGSFFHNNFIYLVNSLTGGIGSYDSNVFPVVTVIIQGIYGIAMLVLPVSVLLIAGLKYLNISYKEWLKYIWKYLIALLIIVLVTGLILAAI